jgi:SAM-dependent methyltransferase
VSICLLPCLKSSGRFSLGKGISAVSSMSLSSSPSPSPLVSEQDAFTELEHKNWQRGVDAYTTGFGPLTSQAVPTLLHRAGFLSASIVNNGGDASCILLDVACGPGQVVEAAVSRAKSSASRTGACCCTYVALDFSSKFLELAERNLKSKHSDTAVTFVEGDAQDMSSVFDDNEFDSVTSNFGILHLAVPDSFLAESYRVLKPGGRLAFSAWSAPPTTEAFDLILGTVKDVGNPNVALPDGPPFFRFSDEDEIRRSLEAAGFVDVETTIVDSMEWTNVDSSDQLYEILLEGTARTRELLKGQTDEETRAVKEELKRRFDERVSEEGTVGRRHLRMPAVISSGRKPLL